MAQSSAPTVSVILPTYNRQSSLLAAVNSVLSQSFADLELIVVDDGSTDATVDLLTGVNDPRLHPVFLSTRAGAAAARNTGIHMARGRYVGFQDSDDVWRDGSLETLVSTFDRAEDDVAVVYGVTRRQRGDIAVRIPQPHHVSRQGALSDALVLDNFICLPAALVRSEHLRAVGGFDERLPRFQDWDLWLRLARNYRFEYIDEELVHSHETPGSITLDDDAFSEALEMLLRSHEEAFARVPEAALHYHAALARRALLRRDARACYLELSAALQAFSWRSLYNKVHRSRRIRAERTYRYVARHNPRPAGPQHSAGPTGIISDDPTVPYTLLMVSAWWPTESSPLANPFIIDHTFAMKQLFQRIHCWAVMPGMRQRSRAAPVVAPSSSMSVESKSPRVPWRLCRGQYGPRLLACAGWWQGRRLGFHPSAVMVQSFEYAGPYAVGAARAIGCPLIYLEHWSGVARQELTSDQLAGVRFVLARSDVILAVSHYLARSLEGIADLPAGSVGVIGNSVDTDIFMPAPPPVHDGTLFVQVADFRPVKDHALLVDALQTMGFDELRHLDIRFLLVGDGPELPDIERRVRMAELSDRVSFAGKLDRAAVARAIGSSDWTLLTSKSENLPCSLIESLAVGRPVVAPHVGGIPEIIDHRDGLLYERSVEGLVGALRSACSWKDQSSWEQRSSRAAHRYDVDALAAAYEQLVPRLYAS